MTHPSPKRSAPLPQLDPAFDGDASPRAPAETTGRLLQWTGLVMILSACCVGIPFGATIRPGGTDSGSILGALLANGNATLSAVGMLNSFLCGLGLVAAGSGLRAERPGSDWLAAVVTGLAGLVYAGCAIAAGVLGRWFAVAGFGLATLWLGAMWMAAAACVSVFRENPPPPDANRVTPEWLDDYHRRRRERRGDF